MERFYSMCNLLILTAAPAHSKGKKSEKNNAMPQLQISWVLLQSGFLYQVSFKRETCLAKQFTMNLINNRVIKTYTIYNDKKHKKEMELFKYMIFLDANANNLTLANKFSNS